MPGAEGMPAVGSTHVSVHLYCVCNPWMARVAWRGLRSFPNTTLPCRGGGRRRQAGSRSSRISRFELPACRAEPPRPPDSHHALQLLQRSSEGSRTAQCLAARWMGGLPCGRVTVGIKILQSGWLDSLETLNWRSRVAAQTWHGTVDGRRARNIPVAFQRRGSVNVRVIANLLANRPTGRALALRIRGATNRRLCAGAESLI